MTPTDLPPTPRSKAALVLGLVALVCAAADAAGNRQTPGDWELVRADLDLRLAPHSGVLQAEAWLRVRLQEATSEKLTLCLNSREPAMRFVGVKVPGAEVELNLRHPDSESARLALIHFERPRTQGEELELQVAWTNVGESEQFAVRPEIALASWVDAWYPVPITEVPDGSERMRAPGTTRLEMPRGWRAVANGQLVESRPSASGVTEIWQVDSAVARSFVAAPYRLGVHRIGGQEFRVYTLSAGEDEAESQATTLAGAISAMEDRWGPYPYPTFSIAEAPDEAFDWYAASEQGFIVAATRAFEVAGGNVPLFAHEAAHGWWGNLVTSEGPGELMTSESLAQYGAVIAIETLEGPAAAADFLRFSRRGYNILQSALGFFHLWREGQDRPLSALDGSGSDHNLSDAKGHWVYHMLRRRVGDEVFFETLRDVIRQHSDSPLSLAELRSAFLETAPPETRLETFFEQWLDHPGAPVLDVDWWSIRRGTAVRVAIRQLQPGTLYDLDLEIEIRALGGTRTRHLVAISGLETVVELATEGRPVELRVDPDHRLLIWEPAYGPRPSETASD